MWREILKKDILPTEILFSLLWSVLEQIEADTPQGILRRVRKGVHQEGRDGVSDQRSGLADDGLQGQARRDVGHHTRYHRAQERRGLVAKFAVHASGEAHQDWGEGGHACSLRDLPNGGGGHPA